METRKIIQISAFKMSKYNTTIVALCEDGTVWKISGASNADSPWYQIRPIPAGDKGD